MAEQNYGEQLDRFVDAVIASPRAPLPNTDAEMASLGRIAAGLRGLPREDFKERLKVDLIRRTSMSSKAVAAPEATTSVTPYLCVSDAAAALEFYKKAFGAVETLRLNGPGPKIGHAEFRIGNAVVLLSDEFPDYGALSPKSIGGSPIKLQLFVPDVDSFVRQAVEAGATLARPVADQFYGDRSGQVADPFGYIWIVSTHKEKVSTEEMQRRIDAMMNQQPAAEAPPKYMREGFHTVQPYMLAADVDAVMRFAQEAFGAEQTLRAVTPGGGIHGELRIGDSMLMLGGGMPAKPNTVALHVYVEDTDAVYAKALAAGATSIGAPQDHEYGERGAGVKDAAGNYWYIATSKGESYIPKGLHNVNVYMHPRRAEPVIRFLKQAFGGEEIGKYASPDGVVHHAEIRVGDSVVEMGEANGPYQPMESMFYVYVPDADAVYQRALAAGAQSLQLPTDQPYGDRNAAVTDAFGNIWYMASRIGEPKVQG